MQQKDADISGTDLKNLLINLKNQFQGDLVSLNETPRFIAIYTDPSLINIKYDKIIAISVIFADEKSLKHSFFVIEQGLAVTTPNWNQRFTLFYNFFLQFFAVNFGDHNTGIILLNSQEPFPYVYKTPNNGLNTAIINYLNAPNLRPISECGAEFNSKCPDPGTDCVNKPSGPPNCNNPRLPDDEDQTGCNAKLANNIIASTGSTLTPLNLNEMSFLKENVLQKYKLPHPNF